MLGEHCTDAVLGKQWIPRDGRAGYCSPDRECLYCARERRNAVCRFGGRGDRIGTKRRRKRVLRCENDLWWMFADTPADKESGEREVLGPLGQKVHNVGRWNNRAEIRPRTTQATTKRDIGELSERQTEERDMDTVEVQIVKKTQNAHEGDEEIRVYWAAYERYVPEVCFGRMRKAKRIREGLKAPTVRESDKKTDSGYIRFEDDCQVTSDWESENPREIRVGV
ncbi:hypothetical protein L596_011380 [Steinernema carpocapsae]|uniref:Uncharacterized protein n=1 Tax=Steinernema carpocapsae TaxID=34508 RepID=A0A4U5NUK9_STECR|nr:hypothetical protein L596_011380 [Steinernema carpocapsae]